MSLGQLTANYTDSEGEDNDRLSDDTSHKSTPVGGIRVTELRDEGSRRGTPFSGESVGSGTPQKKVIYNVLIHEYLKYMNYCIINNSPWEYCLEVYLSIYFCAYYHKIPSGNALGNFFLCP